MTIQVTCSCGKELRARAEYAGKRAKCPRCGQVLVIPQRSTAAPSEDDTAFQLLMSEPSPPESAIPARPPEKPPARAVPTPTDHYGFQDEPPPAPAVPRRRKPTPSVSPPSLPTVPEPAAARSSIRHYGYWLLLLALLPLGFSLFQEETDAKERLKRSIERIPPEKIQILEQKWEAEQQFSMDDLLAALPDGRIEGAHLARRSLVHWVYALLSATAFLGLILVIFPWGTANPRDLLLVGLFTATIGIFFLLAVQYIAMWTQGTILYGRSVVVIIFWVLKFIGFSYRSALDPETNFILSFFGFTFGVGLCEEICKAIPLLVHFRRSGAIGWRAAWLWGLATGVGFGVSEGITYSADFYNGISSGGIYVVRFVSCVALHAVWSAAVAITIYKNQALLRGETEWFPYCVSVVRMVAVPMVLHGLYDTLLKKEMTGAALLVALVSFGWLAWQIEWTRGHEGETAAAGAMARS